MLKGAFITNPREIRLNTTGLLNSEPPLSISANPFQPSGMPLGLVARDGEVYTSVPDTLPALVVYPNGTAEIRVRYTVDTLASASFVVSGSTLLLIDGLRTDILPTLDVMPDAEIDRVAVGVQTDGNLIFVVNRGTLEELRTIMEILHVVDAMMLSYNNVYVNYKRGGIHEGRVVPLSLLEVNQMAELARPIVVIDDGHGGKDPGACALGLKEKDLNLAGARILQAYLRANYEGTYILTRDADQTVDYDTRVNLAAALKADLFVSIHKNSSTLPNRGTGFETFCQTKPLPASDRMRGVVHSHIAPFMVSKGLRDRGRKYANLKVLRDTQNKGIPGMLIETAFINTLSDVKLLQDATIFAGIYKYLAEGIALATGAKKKVLVPPTVPATPKPQTLYRVQTGAYQFRKGAEDLQEALKKAGFNAIIVEDRG